MSKALVVGGIVAALAFVAAFAGADEEPSIPPSPPIPPPMPPPAPEPPAPGQPAPAPPPPPQAGPTGPEQGPAAEPGAPPVPVTSLHPSDTYAFGVAHSPNIAAEDVLEGLSSDGWGVLHFVPRDPGTPESGEFAATALVQATWQGAEGADPMALRGGGRYRLVEPPILAGIELEGL
jgi:hypothetical protein